MLLLLTAVVGVAVFAAVPRDDEVPETADAVVALGGSEARVELAQRLAAETGAHLVLSAGSIDFGQRVGLACDVDATCLRPDPDTTIGEARGMADLAEERGWQTVVVATSAFHANRSRLVFEQCLDDVAVAGAPDPASPEPLMRTAREVAGMLASVTVERAC